MSPSTLCSFQYCKDTGDQGLFFCIFISITSPPGSNKDPPSFLDTYFEGLPLLRCRVLRRKPSLGRNFCCVQPQGLPRQAHSAARFWNSHDVFFCAMFHLLRLKDGVVTTVHSPEFAKLDLHTRARAVVRYIQVFLSYLCRLCSQTSSSFDGAKNQRW